MIAYTITRDTISERVVARDLDRLMDIGLGVFVADGARAVASSRIA
ncbi:hypothetical protein AB0E10_13690 [Streptomyces sp. NPDC048045]